MQKGGFKIRQRIRKSRVASFIQRGKREEGSFRFCFLRKIVIRAYMTNGFKKFLVGRREELPAHGPLCLRRERAGPPGRGSPGCGGRKLYG